MKSIGKCYEILGVKSGATKDELQQAYHDLVKVWHPDRFAHDTRLQARAQERLKEINEAYDAIMAAPGPDPRRGPSTATPSWNDRGTPAAYQPQKDQNFIMTVTWGVILIVAFVLIGLALASYEKTFQPFSNKSQKSLKDIA